MGLSQSDVLSERQLDVASAASGLRLDVWLNQVCDWLPTRSFAANWIEAGKVRTSRGLAKPGFRLREGDVVQVLMPERASGSRAPEPDDGLPLRVLFEDEDLIVINKQPGLVVHPGAGVHSGTLVNAVLAHCGKTLPSLGDETRAGIVHRLDRDTSGVMVVAKSQLALSQLSQQFARHEQRRVYSALCYGRLAQTQLRLETGHGRDPRHRTRFRALPLGEGRRAVTTLREIEHFAAADVSLVECSLETGRTHQIRVHLSHVGHPILGDTVYCRNSEAWARRRPSVAAQVRRLAARQQLHASVLGFKHPASGLYCEFQAPVEADFAYLSDDLRGLECAP